MTDLASVLGSNLGPTWASFSAPLVAKTQKERLCFYPIMLSIVVRGPGYAAPVLGMSWGRVEPPWSRRPKKSVSVLGHPLRISGVNVISFCLHYAARRKKW